MTTQLRARGTWPGSVRLRRGWGAAQARPWNDQTETVASLRLVRGGERFIDACVAWLGQQGVVRTLTPAVMTEQTAVWKRAGFTEHLPLVVFERDLSAPGEPPLHRVEVDPAPDVDRLAAIDDQAFPPIWRVGRGGLVDAITATHTADVLTVVHDGEIVGFSIVGEMSGVSYLQRLAVAPDHGRRGIGRALVRASVDWARRRGARTMMLNTQPDNAAATRLYQSEGFVSLGARLWVLARDVEGRA